MGALTGTPTKVHAHVAAIGPTQARKRLRERRIASLPFRIVFVKPHEHADAPHARVLLRACRERPCRRAAVPAVYIASNFVRDGGLLSYGPDQVDNWRRAASYVDRILRGAKSAELPVQLPTKFQMAVNRRTATASGPPPI
jgi:hypothetical protein